MSESRNTQIAMRKAVIETNLERCRDAAWSNLVEIGRWLNIAKAEGVVGHGEWTQWVFAHTGMSDRTAQRAMQFARELPEGSPIAQLGAAKIGALLTLPAGEREEIAERIDAEHVSSREVEARVKAIREERDEALRLVGVQKKQLAQKESLIKSNETGRRQTDKLLDEAQKRAEKLRGDLLSSEAERVRLAQELETARKVGGISMEAQEEIEGLKRQLAARDREIDNLAEQLDDAQMDLARAGMGGMRKDPATMILSSIGALMAEAGQAPAQLDRVVSPIDEETRRLVLAQAYQVKQWAGTIIVKLGGEMLG